jgi:hypothetical protein
MGLHDRDDVNYILVEIYHCSKSAFACILWKDAQDNFNLDQKKRNDKMIPTESEKTEMKEFG